MSMMPMSVGPSSATKHRCSQDLVPSSLADFKLLFFWGCSSRSGAWAQHDSSLEWCCGCQTCRPHHQWFHSSVLLSLVAVIRMKAIVQVIFSPSLLSVNAKAVACLLDDVQRKSLLVTGQGPSPGQCSLYWCPQAYNQPPCPPRARVCPIINQKSGEPT